MDYYKEIKNKLLDNEIYERVKDYSKERNNKYIIEYCSDKRIISREYKII